MKNSNKDSCTFLELLLVLKEEYKEVSQILKNLAGYVDIKSQVPVEKEIKLFFRDINNSNERDSKIKLYVKRKTSQLSKNVKEMCTGSNRAREKDIAVFDIQDGKIRLYQKQSGNLKCDIVSVDGFFMEDYLALREKQFFHLEPVNINLDKSLSLTIFGEQIVLESHKTDDSSSNRLIKYIFADEKLYATKKNGKKNREELEKMLNTRIPIDRLPDCYIKLLESNYKKNSKPYIRVDNLPIMRYTPTKIVDENNGKDNKFVLTRK